MNTTIRSSARLTAVAIAVAAAAVGSAALAAPASAQVSPQFACGWHPANNSGYVGQYFNNQPINIHTGNDLSCPVIGRGYESHTVELRCQWWDASGNGWEYVTDKTLGVTGWVDYFYVNGGYWTPAC